jgi:hypothetical protein
MKYYKVCAPRLHLFTKDDELIKGIRVVFARVCNDAGAEDLKYRSDGH